MPIECPESISAVLLIGSMLVSLLVGLFVGGFAGVQISAAVKAEDDARRLEDEFPRLRLATKKPPATAGS